MSHQAWERGMIPGPSLPNRKVTSEESFRWQVRPEGEMFEGDIYPDESALDGPVVELIRCGWSFVVLCQKTGKVIVSVFGVPPFMANLHRRSESLGDVAGSLEDATWCILV